VVPVEAVAAAADDATVDDDVAAVEDAVADEEAATPSWTPWSSGPSEVRASPPADATPDGGLGLASAASTVEPAVVETTPTEGSGPGVDDRSGAPFEPEDPSTAAAAESPPSEDAGEPPRADRLAPGSDCAPVAGPRDEDAALAVPATDPNEASVEVTAPLEPPAPAPPAATCDSSSRLE
jgi:hypothetical protein